MSNTENKTELGEATPLTSLDSYRLLGRSGLRVSPLCMGTMNLADAHMSTPENSRKMVEAYIEKGGNFFDTADCYEGGKSEILMGKVLAQHRSRAVIATKFTACTDPKDPNSGGNHRKNMVQSLSASLKRMDLDCVDLLYVHFWEFRTPVEEVMRSLDDLVRSGKVHYIAVSDTPAWKVSQANMLAQLRGWSPFIGMQTQYSLVERTAERDIVPMAQELDIGLVNWGPLAQGMLTGKYNHLTVEAAADMKAEVKDKAKNRTEQKSLVGIDTFRPLAVLGDWTEKNRNIALKVAEVAKTVGRTSAQVAFNWNLQKPGVTAPIFAPRTMKQLEDNISALDFTLTPAQMTELDDVSAIDMGFPQRWGQGDFFVTKRQKVAQRRMGC